MKIKFSGADVFKNLAAVLVGDIERRERSALPYSLALSGGESAVKLFEVLSSKKYEYFDWDDVDFFWVDERCVPQRDSESNVGEAKRHFLRGRIKTENIFGIRGWDCPVEEAKRYSKTVRENVRTENGLPRFDCVILGVGEDGHTASIFPQTMKLLDVDEIYDVSCNTLNGGWRVTMTGRTILNARRILCPISGENKREMFTRLIGDIASGHYSTPAAYILAHAKNAEIFTDINPQEH